MGNTEPNIYEIKKYLTSWVTDVVLSNAASYFNINKISEGTAMTLLNLVYDLRLEDMNSKAINFPGVDLGDSKKSLVAYQVTSENTTAKLISSLETFRNDQYKKQFPNGIRFFIINNEKKRKLKSVRFAEFDDIFNPLTDIIYPSDLLVKIEAIYKTDKARYKNIRDFLASEFDDRTAGVQKDKTLISFDSPEEKLFFYKKVLSGTYRATAEKFVQFSCKLEDLEVSTAELGILATQPQGLLILGPSGCGKSILARQIALEYLDVGLSVVLEGKYYEKDLETLLSKEAAAFGFDSSLDLFKSAEALGIPLLILLDGFNECLADKKAQLLAELEKIQFDRDCKISIIAQIYDPLFANFSMLRVDVDFPSPQTKMMIASAYSGKADNIKLGALLGVVSTSLEAKMIGEIGSENVDQISRFSLFEAFIAKKLKGAKQDGFFLLASIARTLSDNISFSLSERVLDKIIRENFIPAQAYKACLEAKLLDENLGKVSFGHEMFHNFFVAESVVRFSKGASDISDAINAPKNHDKKLLIIGSIDDQETLIGVLSDITDVNLLVSLLVGEGGEFCSKWLDRALRDIFARIDLEIDQLGFELSDESITGVNFVDNTLFQWTTQELALLEVIPFMLSRGIFVKDVFSLIAKFDTKGSEAIKLLTDDAKLKNQDAKYGVFATSYIGFSTHHSAMTMIVSSLHSGFSTFYRKQSVPVELIEELLEKRSLKWGQFYFLLVLLRWDDKLQRFYPYVRNALQNWRSVPYHLFNEILDNITHFDSDEQQRQELIELLNTIHGETQDVWKSTMIFDALSALGALEEDSIAHIPDASAELERLLADKESEENWFWASSFYDRQFDHPYSYAYHMAITELDDAKKKVFYEMALKGTNRSFFATSILIDSTLHLKEAVCPLIDKWMKKPIYDKTSPQDSIKIFLLSHIIHSKYNYPIISRFATASDPLDKSLFAAAEIYYWINRPDLSHQGKKDAAKPTLEAFFDSHNQYVVDTIYESRHNISSPDINRLWENRPLDHIEDAFPEACIKVCRRALQRLGWQKEVLGFSRGGAEVDRHAIYLLERLGGLVDLDVLRGLAEHPQLGEAAVETIKKLSR